MRVRVCLRMCVRVHAHAYMHVYCIVTMFALKTLTIVPYCVVASFVD